VVWPRKLAEGRSGFAPAFGRDAMPNAAPEDSMRLPVAERLMRYRYSEAIEARREPVRQGKEDLSNGDIKRALSGSRWVLEAPAAAV